MAQCEAIKDDGKQCGCQAMTDGSGLCQWHNPAIPEEERQRWRSLGGRTVSRAIQVWQIPDLPAFLEAIRTAKTPGDVLALRRKVAELIAANLIEPAQGEGLRRAINDLRESIIDVEIIGESERVEQARGELLALGGYEDDEAININVKYIDVEPS